MKSLIALGLIAAVMCAALSSCGAADKNGKTITVRDEMLADEIKVTLKNSENSNSETVTPELKDEEGDEYKDYSLNVDTEKYDRMIITSDGSDSIELVVNEFVNGFDISSYGIKPLGLSRPDYEIKSFKYSKTEKDVYIWTPDDYDKNSKEKYSVIYMTDGQNLFEERATQYGSWGVAESVQNMMLNTENRTIVVGIDDSTSNRDSELTPNIGDIANVSDKSNFENGTGKYFSDFVVNTVKPYIEKNYKVYTDAAHNAVCGSSSGGIECFYIGMEHSDKFGAIGALSPAFGLYNDSTWVSYLEKKDFSKNRPKIYIYNGGADDLEKFLLTGAKSMPDNLKKIGYPEDKVTLKIYDKGMHNEAYWRAVFPEFLKIMFTNKK